MKHYKRSLFVLGVSHNAKPADHPVVGGTGDFLSISKALLWFKRLISSSSLTQLPQPLIITITTTTTTTTNKHELKSLHFSLYQHETINKTGYIIVKGVAGPGVGQVTTPFGTIFVFQDPMTVTANRSSAVVAVAQGSSITSSLDGFKSISLAKITLNMKHYKGSLSVLGVTHNTKPADHPVVGGTGDFLFVQGYVTSSPVDLKGTTVVYKIEFHLYWPPYVTKATS
ncbi:hypothetical protein Sjap_009725 [Stephania japonica]|uniref:Dirigent protein n=1 Tax=Stephania japonica TaxID=461633 RepID=A0AAP0J887_9MAGN